MTSQTDAWQKRWQVILACRDCHSQFEVCNPSLAIQARGFRREVAFDGLEVCANCKNLRLVENGAIHK